MNTKLFDGPYYKVRNGKSHIPGIEMRQREDGMLQFTSNGALGANIIVQDSKDTETWLWFLAEIIRDTPVVDYSHIPCTCSACVEVRKHGL